MNNDHTLSLEARLENTHDPPARIRLLLELCQATSSQDAAKSLELAQEARRLAQELGHLSLEARALLEESQARHHLSQPSAALETLQQALVLFQEARDVEGTAQALRSMGVVYDGLGDFERSLSHLIDSLKLFASLGDVKAQARTLNSIGIVYSRSGHPEEGLDYYRRAYALHERIGQRLDAAMARNNTGINLKNLGRYDEAEEVLLEALSLLGPDQTLYRAGALSNLAMVYEKQGRIAEAEAAHLEAAQFVKGQHPAYQIETHLSLGRLYLNQGRLEEAKPLLEQALRVAESSQNKPKRAEIHQALAEFYKREGDLGLALTHLETGYRLEREVFNERSDRQLKNLQISFQVEGVRREAELERRRKLELEQAYAELQALHVEKMTLMQQLERLSIEDALTGLYNRRYLDGRLAEEFNRARRYGHPLSVALADIDNFKQINDRLSHAVGDETLKTLAQLLRQNVRETDVVARYGGEEFALLFLEAGSAEAWHICEKIRGVVETHPWHLIHPNLRVTLSIGLDGDLSRDNPEIMLAEADRRLYQAKHQGKNRVVA